MKSIYILGRVENSKTFQNQMSLCFFIGLYDIETGDDFYFNQKKFWWVEMDFKKINFYKGKMAKNKPENHQNWHLAKIAPKNDKFMK